MFEEDAVVLVVVDPGNDAALVRGLAEQRRPALTGPIAGIGDTVIGAELGALVVLAHDEVDDAADGVGTVHRGRAVLQHFDSLDHGRRNRVDVRCALGRILHHAVPVDQDQGALDAEAAQRNRGGAVTTTIVDLRVGGLAGDRRSLLHQIAQRDCTALGDGLAIDREDRVGRLDVDATDARTRDDDRLELLGLLVTGGIGGGVAGVLREGRDRNSGSSHGAHSKGEADRRRKLVRVEFHTLSNVRCGDTFRGQVIHPGTAAVAHLCPGSVGL